MLSLARHTHCDLVVMEAIDGCLSLEAGVDREGCSGGVDGKEGGGGGDPCPILCLESFNAGYRVSQLSVGTLEREIIITQMIRVGIDLLGCYNSILHQMTMLSKTKKQPLVNKRALEWNVL